MCLCVCVCASGAYEVYLVLFLKSVPLGEMNIKFTFKCNVRGDVHKGYQWCVGVYVTYKTMCAYIADLLWSIKEAGQTRGGTCHLELPRVHPQKTRGMAGRQICPVSDDHYHVQC